MKKLRWQDIVNIVLGAWLAVSPWALGYSDTHTLATWNAVIAGLVIVVVEVIDLDAPGAWEEWTSLILGLWVIVAPFVLGLGSHQAGIVSTVTIGILVALFAAWVLWVSKSVSRSTRKHAGGH